MNILFWNIRENNNSQLVSMCLQERDIDIAIFCEFTERFFEDLKITTGDEYRVVAGNGGCKRIRSLTKCQLDCEVLREASRMVDYKIVINEKEYLLAGIHLEDRRNYSASSRKSTIRGYKSCLESDAKELKTNNTIVIGDFNSNPYDTELLGFDGFNAVLFKDVIMDNEYRTHEGDRIKRFYNPILNFLSEDDHMYGSFYNTSHDDTSVWYCLDQVLLSKELANSVVDIKYLRTIGDVSLMNRVKPKEEISDHLPLFVVID